MGNEWEWPSLMGSESSFSEVYPGWFPESTDVAHGALLLTLIMDDMGSYETSN